tara:strand:- start:1629 stop:1868 length:240 start_codon:yes stop_codon:yes gene_type:complete
MKGEKKVLVIYDDPEGLGRAWARGPVSQAEVVDRVAGEQLAKYRLKKAEVGDHYLAECGYTKRVIIDDDFALPDRGSDE